MIAYCCSGIFFFSTQGASSKGVEKPFDIDDGDGDDYFLILDISLYLLYNNQSTIMMYYSTTLFIFLSVWKFMLHPAGAFTSITESSSGLVVSPSHQSLQRNRHQQRSSHHELLTPLTTFHSSSSFFNHDHYQQQQQHQQQHRSSTVLYNTRRSFLNDVVSTSTTAVSLFFNTAIMTGTLVPTIAAAATAEEEEQQQQQPDNLKTVQTPLYYILRVREATEQETRLIKSGKFKDVQRANVKLAVKFMVDNYRLNDNFIAASAFLTGDRRIKAGDIGQTVVQNLYTILEYFDASDVENIKVSGDCFDMFLFCVPYCIFIYIYI